MKRIASITLTALICFGLYSFIGEGEKYTTLKVGSEAPMTDYEMKSTSGEVMTLAKLKKENGLLVVFSCNTCPFVIAWEDRYPGLFKAASQSDIGMALINSNEAKREGEDSMDKMAQHAKEKGYKEIPYLIDEKSALANSFGGKTTPHVFLFDKEMKLVYEGAIDDNHKDASAVEANYLKNALKNLSMGKEIDPSKTKALGCSIKRVKS